MYLKSTWEKIIQWPNPMQIIIYFGQKSGLKFEPIAEALCHLRQFTFLSGLSFLISIIMIMITLQILMRIC